MDNVPIKIGDFSLKPRLYDMTSGAVYVLSDENPDNPSGLYVMGSVPCNSVVVKNDYGIKRSWESELRLFKVNVELQSLIVPDQNECDFFPVVQLMAGKTAPTNSTIVAKEAIEIMAKYLEKKC